MRKRKRNILEIHIKKQIQLQNNEQTKPRNLTFDELSIFIFDILHIQPKDIVTIDYITGRYDHREIKLKPGVEATPFLETKNYLNPDIKVTKQSQSITKVIFRNVPLNVPDEEIMNVAVEEFRGRSNTSDCTTTRTGGRWVPEDCPEQGRQL